MFALIASHPTGGLKFRQAFDNLDEARRNATFEVEDSPTVYEWLIVECVDILQKDDPRADKVRSASAIAEKKEEVTTDKEPRSLEAGKRVTTHKGPSADKHA